jgi:hypothetical protein
MADVAEKIKITPEMMEAGVRVLKEHHLALADADLLEYPAIAQTVFLAMAAFLPERVRKEN